jgi:hypothetical protein
MKLLIMHYPIQYFLHYSYMCCMDLKVESVLQVEEMQYELQNLYVI